MSDNDTPHDPTIKPAMTVDFAKDPTRRVAHPSPGGVLPLPKRRRAGSVNLAEWDAKVAADNAANGTESIQAEQPTFEEGVEHVTPTGNVKPSDPEGETIIPPDGTLEIAQPPAAETKGAILETAEPSKPTVVLPQPSAEAIAAAKQAIADEEAAARANHGDQNQSQPEDQTPPPGTIPPPPQARKNARKQAANQSNK